MFSRSAILFLLLASIGAAAQADGSVTGVVLDPDGKPLVKARVHIAKKGSFYGSRVIQFYETDAEGKFVINHVPWGTYVVMAGKESEGYADTTGAFYSNLDVPTVELGPLFPTANVAVRFRAKAGVLQIASITDATTGEKINNAGITLRRVDNPGFFMSTSTSVKRILVPSKTAVNIQIEQQGYERWPPPDRTKLGEIRLDPEQVFDLEVKLQPLSGLGAEIERMVQRAAYANNLMWRDGKVTGPLPPPPEDIQRLQQLAAEGRSALAQYLQPGKDPLDQIGAISLLANIGGDQSLDMIDEFAERAQDPLVRTEALKRLATSKRPKDLALLQQTSTADPDPKVRDTALKLLERLKPNN